MSSTVVLRERSGVRILDLPAAAVVGFLIAASAAVRFVATALPIRTPYYLPDEYTYTAIARSLAETGRPLIRTAPAHFPALLEPLLAAPFWLTHDPQLAFRLTQAEHSLLMSLGAIPVYLLCRRLGLETRTCLLAVVLALVSPDFTLGSLVVSEAVAYPLVLFAVYAAVVALSKPSRFAQLAVVGLVGLATFARVQYALLVPVFVVATLVVARFDLKRAWKTFGLASVTFGAFLAVALASGPSRVLGAYRAVFDLHASAHAFGHAFATHAVLIGVAAGVVLVPGALIGLAGALTGPRSSAESAFAAITVLLVGGLVAQAVFVAATVSDNFEQRYLFFCFPLLAPAFALYARRGGSRLPAVALSVLIALGALVFPLSHYLARSSDSTMLWAVERLAADVGVHRAAVIAGATIAALASLAAFVAFDLRRRAPLALAVAVASQAIVAVGAAADSTRIGKLARAALPNDPQWIDHARVGNVTLVSTAGNNAGAGVEEALWNRTVTRVVGLPGSRRFDPGEVLSGRIAANGSIVTSGVAVAGNLLVDRDATWTDFAGARIVRTTVGAGSAAFDLWAPTSTRAPHVTALAEGVRADGWLARTGSVTFWPSSVARRFSLRIALPDARAATDTMHLAGPGFRANYTAQPLHSRTVSFVVPASTRTWTLEWTCDRYGYRNGGEVSFTVGKPRLVDVSGPQTVQKP